MWNISTCLLNKNSTQNFKRSIGSGSHPQNARETGGRSYRFPFCTKIRGLLAVQIGASLPSAPWGVWCQQNVFCSQKFTSLSLCLMFNLLWIRNINMLLFLFNVSNKNAKKQTSNYHDVHLEMQTSQLYAYASWSFNTKPRIKQKPRNLFAPPQRCWEVSPMAETGKVGPFHVFSRFLGFREWSHIQDFIVRQASTWCLWFWVLDQWKLVAQECPKLTWQLIVHQWCLHWRLKFQALQSLIPLRSLKLNKLQVFIT